MNGHVAKPVRRNELLAAIARWVPVTTEPVPQAAVDTSSAAVLDEETFAEVTGLLGREKVDGLLARLRAQLQGQFPVDPEMPEVLGRAWLEEAHKLIATAGMLGLLVPLRQLRKARGRRARRSSRRGGASR